MGVRAGAGRAAARELESRARRAAARPASARVYKMPMLSTLLCRPVAPLTNPEDYLKATGEALALLFVVAWTVTFAAAPTYHGDHVVETNPLKDRIGYNNLCVGFDTRPAVYFAQTLWIVVSYFAVRFAWVDTVRSSILRKQGLITRCQQNLSNSLAALYVISVAYFGLVFVISPLEGPNAVWYHSVPFLQYIIVRWVVVVGNFAKYRSVGGAGPGTAISMGAKMWLVVYSLVSVLYPLALVIDYISYDKNCATNQYECEVVAGDSPGFSNATAPGLHSSLHKPEPAVPWWLSCILDYTWFLCLPLTTKFLPPNESLQLEYSWRSIEKEDRLDAHAEKMRPRSALPMEEQAYTEKDSIQPSSVVALLLSCFTGGDQTGAYFADVLNVQSSFSAALFSKTGGKHASCPFARRSDEDGGATVHLGHAKVVQTLLAREAKLEGGEAVRRNDLGLLRLNSTMFPRTGSILLGSDVKDHKVYRDFFGEGFSKFKPKPGLSQRLQEQVLSRSRIDVSMKGDLAIWSNRELWMTLIDISLTREEGAAWVEHQAEVVALVGKPAKLAKGGKTIEDKLKKWLPMIRTALESNTGAAANQLDILADAVYDTLVFAGGLSVPMVLISVTGLRMNGVVPRDHQIDPALAQNFALEAVRCFPPVFSVTQWTKDGSQQTIAAIATAMNDPGVFEPGFKCERSMAEFDEKGCSFAELAGPKYGCPGRTFALDCIATYALAFKPSQWRVHGAGPQDQTLLTKPSPPFFRDAVLLASGNGEDPGRPRTDEEKIGLLSEQEPPLASVARETTEASAGKK
eukprot:COSAG01_NODE_2009_length_8658_cov_51.264867_2_plen_801_part_00